MYDSESVWKGGEAGFLIGCSIITIQMGGENSMGQMTRRWKMGIMVFLGLCLASSPLWAEMGTMSLKSGDIDVQFMGSLKTFPTFLSDVDFNSDDTNRDYILDENGAMSDFSIRNEARIGWLGKGENWDFMIILEADFNLNKDNGDRGADNTSPVDSGMTGEDFGIEKLNFTYNFGPFGILTGWNTKALDIQTGGLVYGDDHPYVGFSGTVGENFSWEALYLSIFDKIENMDKGAAIGPLDADDLDWQVYSLKLTYQWGPMAISPFYAYSDNSDEPAANAKTHYFGAEAYGKIGIVTPRLELAYAVGDTDTYDRTGQSYDISALAAYGSVEVELDPRFVPYIGLKYEEGDDDPNDDDIEAFNSITDISRYTPTFGMENAFIYRLVPTLGTHLYSGNFNFLPKARGIAQTPGYGGISNSSSGDAPGLIMLGLGAKGKFGDLSYQAQIMQFWFDTSDGMEELLGRDVDSDVGMEFDLLLRYQFGPHFSVGNNIAVFNPGDAIEDIWDSETASSNDEIAFMDTIELTWTW